MKKDVARFGKAVLVVVAMLVAGDFAVGILADSVAERMPYPGGHNLVAKECYIFHGMNEEFVILGSSRGHYHYVTSILNDSIDAFYGAHRTVYNAAIIGQFANCNACAAEAILSRYHPKLVIYDLYEFLLRTEDRANAKLPAPFYRKDTVVRRYIDNISTKERILMKSNLYRYQNLLLPIASGYFRSGEKDGGYVPIYGSYIDTTEIAQPVAEDDARLDDYIRANFERVLRLYTSEGVPLIIVCSPIFRSADNNNQLKSICEDYGVPFIDLSDMPYFNAHPELFKDRTHLNDGGARVYTSVFFGYLKPYLSTL